MIIAFALFSLFRLVYSLPVAETNVNGSVPISPVLTDSSEPTQHDRKALDILWSCYATTLSCTWAAVHPNMSFFGENRLGPRLRRRIWLMLLALLVPELMVCWSFAQLTSARRITSTIESNKYAVDRE